MRRLSLLGLCLAIVWGQGAAGNAQEQEIEVGAYPLDALSRTLPIGAPLPCDVPLTTYRGEQVRYRRPARVYVGFASHLQAFEKVLIAQAVAKYGRAPRSLEHMGTQSCRRMRRYPEWVSEHALANGIDIAGFDFGPLPAAATAPEGMPPALRRAFSVRVDKNWDGGRGAASDWHSSFLHALIDDLIARPDIFHVLLGPGYPGHKNHFHFDYAPYRVVDGF